MMFSGECKITFEILPNLLNREPIAIHASFPVAAGPSIASVGDAVNLAVRESQMIFLPRHVV